MIIHRLGNQYINKPALDNFISIVKKYPNACSEVWFPSAYGYPTKETMYKNGDAMIKSAAILRELGIKVSLQISNTIGHGDYIKSYDFSGAHFQGIVGPDGVCNDYCFCPNSKEFLDYLKIEMEAYCRFQPYSVWIDDDFRLLNHYPVQFGCFCDNCINSFNHLHNRNFTRDELVKEINSISSFEWRDKWVEFEKTSMINLISHISKSVISVSKDTTIGIQHCVSPIYTGGSHKPFFDEIMKITGKPPLSRPGGGFYNEYKPREMIDKAYTINKQVSMLPEYLLDIVAEMEDLPHSPMVKGVRANCIEGTLDIALGCNKLSLTTLSKDYETDWHEKMLCGLSEYEPYWQKLIKSNKSTTSSGFLVYNSSNKQHKKMAPNSQSFEWANDWLASGEILAQLGLPVSYEEKCCAVLLSSSQAEIMSDIEIKNLLAQPVITDGETLNILCQRGYSEYFPLEVKKEDTHLFRISLAEHRFNEGHQNEVWQYCDFDNSDKPFYLLPQNEDTQVLEEFINFTTGEKAGSCSVITKTASGGNWAVFGSHFWDLNVTTGQRQLLMNVANYISNGLPAYIKNPVQIIVIPRVNDVGELVDVTLLNIGIDKLTSLELVIKNPVFENFVLKSASFEKKLDFNKNQSAYETVYEIKIDSLSPWEIATVFAEK